MTKQSQNLIDPQLSDKSVTMSNAVARACQSLSLAEKRIVASAIAQTDTIELAENQGWKVKFTALEYANTFDLDENTAYEQLQSAKTLFNKHIRFMENTKRGLKERQFHWISGLVYHHGEGWLELNFSPEVAPHLLLLKEQFTTYKLRQAAALKSGYSWRLFECLRSWRDTGLWLVTIDEFTHAMDVPDKYREDFTDIRRRVIEPSVAELILKGGISIDWTTKKAGRKIIALEFRFKFEDDEVKEAKPTPVQAIPKPLKALPAKESGGGSKRNGVPKSAIVSMARVGESWEDAEARLRDARQPGESWEDAAARLRGK